MLELLHAVAYRLGPLRPLALAALLAGAVAFVWSVLADAPDRYLMAGLLAALWGGWLFTLLATFQQPPPDGPAGGALRARLSRRLRRVGYLAMAWLLIGSFAAGALLSLRLLSLGSHS